MWTIVIINHQSIVIFSFNYGGVALRVFISQPMKDKTQDEIIDNIKRLKNKLSEKYDEEIFIIPSYDPANKLSSVPLACLGQSLILLSTADLVYFSSGWNKARGCRIECMCALEYGIKTEFEDDICEDFMQE